MLYVRSNAMSITNRKKPNFLWSQNARTYRKYGSHDPQISPEFYGKNPRN